MEINKWMRQLTAAEVMTHNPVTVNSQEPIALAAEIMLRERVSGLPVVDNNNLCVGVVSASDFVGAEQKVTEERDAAVDSSFWNSSLALPLHVYSEQLEKVRDKLGPTAEQPVERFMTADLVVATEETSLLTIVQSLVDAHVHRIIILDENSQLKGVVSTTDVLAALLNASRVS